MPSKGPPALFPGQVIMSDGAPTFEAQHARHGAQHGAALSSFLRVRAVTAPLDRWED